ncbi:unnamed protein product [Vitrella brassicaformis CCMP3155]|uniref:Uncharacterized protein n=1 Tax=Vitrella brassicaformis (strain CCMP3155) TaxID=1169540 RepID=A0A0G4H6S5_VITBC|nr:unnamed protein product [Vitrella brassicaformis CCMP3155]|eukprot:CEM39386.1 unnamed protein product [Vitrella brassicaformis CCMP3155]
MRGFRIRADWFVHEVCSNPSLIDMLDELTKPDIPQPHPQVDEVDEEETEDGWQLVQSRSDVSRCDDAKEATSLADQPTRQGTIETGGSGSTDCILSRSEDGLLAEVSQSLSNAPIIRSACLDLSGLGVALSIPLPSHIHHGHQASSSTASSPGPFRRHQPGCHSPAPSETLLALPEASRAVLVTFRRRPQRRMDRRQKLKMLLVLLTLFLYFLLLMVGGRQRWSSGTSRLLRLGLGGEGGVFAGAGAGAGGLTGQSQHWVSAQQHHVIAAVTSVVRWLRVRRTGQ